jgi:hypothetical protein
LKYESIPPVKNTPRLTLKKDPILKLALFVIGSAFAAFSPATSSRLAVSCQQNFFCYHPLREVVNPTLPFTGGLVMVALQFRLGCSGPALSGGAWRGGTELRAYPLNLMQFALS